MSDVKYIKGNLLLDTDSTVFKYKSITAGCDGFISPPAGAEEIEENTDKGYYLISDDNNNSSYFHSYYASGGFTTYGRSKMRSVGDVEWIYKDFVDSISKIQQLIEHAAYDKKLLPTLYRYLFIGAIASFEAYLSDTMLCWVFSYRERFDKYISIGENKSIKLKDVVAKKYNIEDIVYKDIQDKLYHRLDDVDKLYKENIGVKLPDTKKMKTYIHIRHDLVHRNGKDEEKKEVVVNKSDLLELLRIEQNFVDELYQKIRDKFLE